MTELVILAILGARAAAFGSQDLGLKTWVAGSRWSWSLWPVPPQKTLLERRRTDARTHGRTDAHTVCNYI
jgi:hypothetical protein